jgi:hypothetical protein
MKRQNPSSGDDLSTESENSSVSRRSDSGRRKKRIASSTAVPTVAVPVSERSETMKSYNTPEEKISKPTPFDVLFGRGKPYQGHPGNIRLHKIVDVHRSRYLRARRYDKFAISEEIVRNIKAPPESGRFLKRAEGEDYWEEVSDPVAQEKVSHALRGKPRKDNFADSGRHHDDEVFLGGATISGAPVYLHRRPRGGAPSGVIPGVPLSLAGGPTAAYSTPQLVPMIPAAAGLPYFPPGLTRLVHGPSAGIFGLPAHRATFPRAPPLLAQGQSSSFNGIPIEMLSDEQLIVQAMLQRRQRENAGFGGLPRGFPPQYYY